MGRHLPADRVQRANPRAGQLGDAGEIGDERDRAAPADRQQPPGQLIGGGDVDRAAHQRPGRGAFRDGGLHGEGRIGRMTSVRAVVTRGQDGGPAKPVPQGHDRAPPARRAVG